MAKLYIEPTKAQGLTNREADLAQTLRSIAKEVEDIRSNLRYRIAGQEQVSTRLQIVSQQITRESRAAQDMKNGLEQIIVRYKQAEDKCVEQTYSVKAVALNRNGENGGSGEMETGATDSQLTSLFGEDNTYQYQPESGKPIAFHLGLPTPPRWEPITDYDCFYPYNSTEKATLADVASWNLWKAAPLYGMINYVPDGIRAYEHYRSGSGEPLEIDYAKAYREDGVVARHVNKQVNNAEKAVQQMINQGAVPPFSITSELIEVPENPATENWQKTIGRHHIWISADVSENQDGSTALEITVHEIDRYNFNKSDADIKTGLKDKVNGRFETLGWAKSFDTYGEITFQSTLSDGPSAGYIDPKNAARDGSRAGTRSGRRDFRSDRRDSKR